MEPGEDVHDRGVVARQLKRQRGFDLIARLDAFDECKSRIDGDLGDPGSRKAARGN